MAPKPKMPNVSESTRLRLDGIVNSGYSIPRNSRDPVLDSMETDTLGRAIEGLKFLAYIAGQLGHNMKDYFAEKGFVLFQITSQNLRNRYQRARQLYYHRIRHMYE